MQNSDNQSAKVVDPARKDAGSAPALKCEKPVVAAFISAANLDKALILAEFCAFHRIAFMAVETDSASPSNEFKSRGAQVVAHDKTDPRAAAVKAASALGYTHVLTIDPTETASFKTIPSFIKIMKKFPHAVVLGRAVPKSGEGEFKPGFLRRAARILASLECLSSSVEDPYCPVRLYPVSLGMRVLSSARISKFICADYELLVRMMWAGARLRFTSIPFERLPQRSCGLAQAARMHVQYLAGAFVRLPILLWSRFFGWTPEASFEAAGAPSSPRAEDRPLPNADAAPKARRVLSADEADRAVKAQQAAYEARKRAEAVRSSLESD